MKLRMCVLVFLTMVASVLAQVPDSQQKKDDSSNIISEINLKQPVADGVISKQVRIEDFNGEKCLVDDKEYLLVTMVFDVKQSGIQVICRATTDSTPPSTFGAILYRFENDKWDTVRNLGWNIVLDKAKFKDVTFKISFDEMGKKDGRYRLIIYRSNNQGTLIIENIRVEKLDNNVTTSGDK